MQCNAHERGHWKAPPQYLLALTHTHTYTHMCTQGTPKLDHWKDKWTVVTKDGGLSAQYEHTILITPTGCEVLTQL